MPNCPHCGISGRYYKNEPVGYVQWHEWAEKMSKNYVQEQCPGCGRFSIWRKKCQPDLRPSADGPTL